MTPSERWKDLCGHMVRMSDKIERARGSITHDEWFESGPSLYAIEQLQAARVDLDRILKVCSDRRADVIEENTDTILYEEPEEEIDPETRFTIVTSAWPDHLGPFEGR